MPLPYWLWPARCVRRRLTDLERNMEIIMSELDDLKANETDLEGAVADAIDEVHALNAQLQSQIAANGQNAAVPEGIKAVAASLAAATARLRAALPTKANPAPEPVAPEAPPAPVAPSPAGGVDPNAAPNDPNAGTGTVADAGGSVSISKSLDDGTQEVDPAKA